VTPRVHVLLVEPDVGLRARVVADLTGEGAHVTSLQRAAEVLPAMETAEFDAVFLALRLPDRDGLELLPHAVAAHPSVPIVVITAFSSIPSAVEAMRRGAADYLPKPFSPEQLLLSLRKVLERRALQQEVSRLRQLDTQRYGVEAIIGSAPLIRSLRAHVHKIAKSPATTVLILGESGVGKDLVARALHQASPRASRAFVAVNCAAIPETLLESELFGFEPGAFTGARRPKRGLLEAAHGGTVFLDEIGDLGVPLQAKLLRFLEDQRIRRLGGTEDIEVDVRVVAATNMDLGAGIAGGRFREDLYYRLMVVPLFVPPLRERKEDIPLLALHFLDQFNKRFRKHFDGVAPATLERMRSYRWPGNVRELRNAIERIVLLEDGPLVEAAMLPWSSPIPPPAVPGAEATDLPLPGDEDLRLERLELRALVKALERYDGNLSRAARVLGISRDTVRARIKRFNVRVKARVSVDSSRFRAFLEPAREVRHPGEERHGAP
jgi:DNA-binding NtrC family response regulator